MSLIHHKINYLEFPATDLSACKTFFEKVFDWSFTDYGEDYTAFEDGVMTGGFYRAEQHMQQLQGSALVVIYSQNLEQTQVDIETAGGTICQDIFAFPGGRRFHFQDPCKNEFAVWSDT